MTLGWDDIWDDAENFCIVYSYKYLEETVQRVRDRFTDVLEAFLIQPHGEKFCRSAASLANKYFRLLDRGVPIFFTPHGRTQDQFFTHVGRVAQIVESGKPGITRFVETKKAEGKLLLPFEDELVYAQGTFLFVYPVFKKLRKRVPVSAMFNVLGRTAGLPAKSVSVPAPKRVSEEYQGLLKQVPTIRDSTFRPYLDPAYRHKYHIYD